MKKSNKLDYYLCSNLIVSFLSLSLLVNYNQVDLISISNKEQSDLSAIYSTEVEDIVESNSVIQNTVTESVAVTKKDVKSYNYEYVKPSYNSLTGSNLVNYAKKFLGLRYVYAGRSLATGTDCSGFTSLIYKEFGIYLPPIAGQQASYGSYVSKNDLQPGDLVFYSYGGPISHVAIYIGDGLIIHESTPKKGTIISPVNIMVYVTARRLITSNVTSPSFIVNENDVNNNKNNNNNVISSNNNDNNLNENAQNDVIENVIETTNEDKPVVEEPVIENTKPVETEQENTITENVSTVETIENVEENVFE